MHAPAPDHGCVRFGAFEVDLRTGELRQNGNRVRLQERPFQILTVLLERPGEVVTREEIQQRLWPADTFVDFEHSINTAVNKLRETLGDSAEHPRYIETLPRHGYRFIAPVDAGAGPARPRKDKAFPYRMTAAASAGVVALIGVLLALNVSGLRDRALTLLRTHHDVPLPKIEVIAVLPLENLSGDPKQEYFADGLTDALITDLGKVATLRVISRTSVMQYKRGKKPLPQIARELNVDAVVEGTVQRSGDRVRITAQLLDARTDRHLWGESYERDSADVIQLEKQMALAIAHEVSGRLTTAEETRLASKRAVNPRAYDAYLHGRYLWNERDPEIAGGARAYFEQALREDPGFALAYSGLADYYTVGWGLWTDQRLAEKYARKAVALEPNLAEAHASLGITCAYQRKFPEADKELKWALELNPNYVMGHHWYSLHLWALGRLSEALAENDRARQLDPFSLPVNFLRGLILIGLHEYDRAIEQSETAAAINPHSEAAHGNLARIYWIEGRVPEALAEERKVATLTHDPALAHDQDEIGAAYAKGGVRAAQLKAALLMEETYERSSQDVRTRKDTAVGIALQYGLLGDREKVLRWLNQALRDEVIWGNLNRAPELDFLRSDPRFQDLLRRLNFPP